jgi:hypothetical protein
MNIISTQSATLPLTTAQRGVWLAHFLDRVVAGGERRRAERDVAGARERADGLVETLQVEGGAACDRGCAKWRESVGGASLQCAGIDRRSTLRGGKIRSRESRTTAMSPVNARSTRLLSEGGRLTAQAPYRILPSNTGAIRSMARSSISIYRSWLPIRPPLPQAICSAALTPSAR